MRRLTQNNIKDILLGANLLSTGGGGKINYRDVVHSLRDKNKLISISELKENDIACSVFGVGGNGTCNPSVASRAAMFAFNKIISKKIKAIIPVEVGTIGIFTSLIIAGDQKIPILDSDLVGLRSSPEIYLETITLAGLKRTPCVIANDKGQSLLVEKAESPAELEFILRTFAKKSGGDAYVAGYPLRIKDIKEIVPENSLTLTQNLGRDLNLLKNKKTKLKIFCETYGFKLFGIGKIISAQTESSGGFEKGFYIIKSNTDKFKIIFKNENLILIKNNFVTLTCPDSICLLNVKSLEGINNFEINLNKHVAILGKKSIPLWRTKKGKNLFSPIRLGFDYQQKLMV